MRILLIPDKFKGSLTAQGVIDALKCGVKKACPKADFVSVLASDGGDGFLKAISQNIVCTEIHLNTLDPLGRKIKSNYLLDEKGGRAFIELAKASGLELLSPKERSAMDTTTYGTGLEIKDALDQGITEIYIGLGGSATNDAGMGMAAAFGYRFLDSYGNELEPIGKNLSRVASIESTDVSLPSDFSVFAVNDVDNPLFGKNGAAHTYAKQKGATDKQIEKLDSGLKHFSEVVKKEMAVDAAFDTGSGAAGGTAYGLRTFLAAEFISGIDFVMNVAGVTKLLEEKKFDYIITGEGKFDDQTLNGKLVQGVVKMGSHYNIPVLAVCGQLEIDHENLQAMGIEAALEVSDTDKSLAYNMAHARRLIEKKIYDHFMKIQHFGTT
ncbi:glycerate kinase [Maribacter algicola]|uniref:Glycerate kinase n=1 Tax=Meishania litoralis TaxID=3434685 RepID=A0ACC7LQD6_9FLAO